MVTRWGAGHSRSVSLGQLVTSTLGKQARMSNPVCSFLFIQSKTQDHGMESPLLSWALSLHLNLLEMASRTCFGSCLLNNSTSIQVDYDHQPSDPHSSLSLCELYTPWLIKSVRHAWKNYHMAHEFGWEVGWEWSSPADMQAGSVHGVQDSR